MCSSHVQDIDYPRYGVEFLITRRLVFLIMAHSSMSIALSYPFLLRNIEFALCLLFGGAILFCVRVVQHIRQDIFGYQSVFPNILSHPYVGNDRSRPSDTLRSL